MRGLRTTIALAVVLVGLAAYIYFVTSKKPDSGTAPPKEHVFASLDGDKIDELTIKSESGDTTTVKKDKGTWDVTAPLETKADEQEVSAITSNLATVDITRVVDENPTDLKQYGLDQPRVEVDFKASGDKASGDSHRLFIGAKSPTGSDLFARRDADKRVLLIPATTDPVFNRSTFDLRSKTVLTFNRDKVDRIQIAASGKTRLELAKDGMDWKIVQPVSVAADNMAVEALISRLQTLAMKAVAAEHATPDDLKKDGFDKPQGTITLHEGSDMTALIVGGKAGEDVYARDSSKPQVVTVDALVAKDLEKGPDDYRPKEIVTFSGFDSDRVEFTRDGKTTVFEKVKAQGSTPEKWRRVSPNAGDVDISNMDSLFSRLSGLRATAFLDSRANTGLDKPALTVYAKFDDGKKEDRVMFGRSANDVYAGHAGQPGALKISTTDLDDVLKALDLVSK
jgi:hypothetical protein